MNPPPLLIRMSPHRGRARPPFSWLIPRWFSVSVTGVDERRDASFWTSNNRNAMSWATDIRDASSRTSDDDGCLVPGGGRVGIRPGGRLGPYVGQGGGAPRPGWPTTGETSARTADGGRRTAGRRTAGRPRTYILHTLINTYSQRRAYAYVYIVGQ